MIVLLLCYFLFLQKKKGLTTGWIGYTLSWTNRKFENINFGEWYPYKYDRRHDFSEPNVHPSRQIEVGMFDAKGLEYWENRISRDVARFGSIALDSFVDNIAGDDDEDYEYRESILANVTSLINKSKKLTVDRDNNIIISERRI